MSRLIDADALVEAVKNYPYGYRGLTVCTIAEQPTIEPERKKGKWIYNADEDTYMCSVCQARIDPIDKFKSYFCYHCGADMGEGESNALD